MKTVVTDLLAFCLMALLVMDLVFLMGLGWFIFSPLFESFYVLFTISFIVVCILIAWSVLKINGKTRGGGHK